MIISVTQNREDLIVTTGILFEIIMDTQYYLLKFRKCCLLDSVERLCDKFNQELSGSQLVQMHRAADHRRAELAANQLFDIGRIPRSLWSQVR